MKILSIWNLTLCNVYGCFILYIEEDESCEVCHKFVVNNERNIYIFLAANYLNPSSQPHVLKKMVFCWRTISCSSSHSDQIQDIIYEENHSPSDQMPYVDNVSVEKYSRWTYEDSGYVPNLPFTKFWKSRNIILPLVTGVMCHPSPSYLTKML